MTASDEVSEWVERQLASSPQPTAEQQQRLSRLLQPEPVRRPA